MKKKAKIYIPAKVATQSGRGKQKTWVLEFETEDPNNNTFMGWESSSDTLKEVRLKFESKEKATDYATANHIEFSVVEPKKKTFVIKPYEENFTKN